jgi:hypothetical protein
MAYLADGQHERAVECALRSLRENRTYTSAYRQLAMTPGLAGREDEAQALTRHLLELEWSDGSGLPAALPRQRQPARRSLLLCSRGPDPAFRKEWHRHDARIKSGHERLAGRSGRLSLQRPWNARVQRGTGRAVPVSGPYPAE